MPSLYANLPSHARDSLELASLASSSQLNYGHGQAGGDGNDGNDGDSGSAALSSRASLSSSRKVSLEQEDPLHNSLEDGLAGSSFQQQQQQRRGRNFSISSGFDLAANLFPLSSSTAGGGHGYAPLSGTMDGGGGGGGGLGLALGSSRAGGGGGGIGLGGGGGATLERHKSLTFLNGLSLIVGLIIGSGIFSSPSLVNANVGSPGAALLVWVAAGVLAWTGASSFAELGGAIPLNGGAAAYLGRILGELFGFLFVWVAVLVLKPGGAAIVAIIMGEYLVRAAVGAESEAAGPWTNKTVALVGVLAVTLMNCVSTRLGTRVNDLLMVLKFVALLGVTVTGIVVAATGFSFEGRPSLEWKTHAWFAGTSTDASAWAVALYAGLWAYDGWDNTNYVVGEFRNPSRDLPRVIHTAMPLVIVSYVLANVAYFLVLSLDSINSTNTVAVVFGHKVFGPVGSLVFALIVSASCFGALNSSTFTSSRLVYAASREGYLPGFFGQLGLGAGVPPVVITDSNNMAPGAAAAAPRRGCRGCLARLARPLARLVADEDTGLFFTPIYALVLNGALTCCYVLVGEFGTLLTFYGVAGYTFYFLTVLGLIVLRVREPDLDRPYKAWITTPIIFCCVSLFLLSRAVFAQPLQTLIVVAFTVAGVPVYYWQIRKRSRPNKRESDGPGRRWWKFWKR